MQTYTDDQLKAMIESGDPQQMTIALTRAYIPDSLVQLAMTEDPDREVVLCVIGRALKVTPEQLSWAARVSDDGLVLNRVIGHPNSPISLIVQIRDRAAEIDDAVHMEMVGHADRLLERRMHEG